MTRANRNHKLHSRAAAVLAAVSFFCSSVPGWALAPPHLTGGLAPEARRQALLRSWRNLTSVAGLEGIQILPDASDGASQKEPPAEDAQAVKARVLQDPEAYSFLALIGDDAFAVRVCPGFFQLFTKDELVGLIHAALKVEQKTFRPDWSGLLSYKADHPLILALTDGPSRLAEDHLRNGLILFNRKLAVLPYRLRAQLFQAGFLHEIRHETAPPDEEAAPAFERSQLAKDAKILVALGADADDLRALNLREWARVNPSLIKGVDEEQKIPGRNLGIPQARQWIGIHQADVYLGLADIDWLSYFNDLYGHTIVTDLVIRKTGEAIQRVVRRHGGFVYKYQSGDEFGFVLPSGLMDQGTREITGVKEIDEELRRAVVEEFQHRYVVFAIGGRKKDSPEEELAPIEETAGPESVAAILKTIQSFGGVTSDKRYANAHLVVVPALEDPDLNRVTEKFLSEILKSLVPSAGLVQEEASRLGRSIADLQTRMLEGAGEKSVLPRDEIERFLPKVLTNHPARENLIEELQALTIARVTRRDFLNKVNAALHLPPEARLTGAFPLHRDWWGYLEPPTLTTAILNAGRRVPTTRRKSIAEDAEAIFKSTMEANSASIRSLKRSSEKRGSEKGYGVVGLPDRIPSPYKIKARRQAYTLLQRGLEWVLRDRPAKEEEADRRHPIYWRAWSPGMLRKGSPGETAVGRGGLIAQDVARALKENRPDDEVMLIELSPSWFGRILGGVTADLRGKVSLDKYLAFPADEKKKAELSKAAPDKLAQERWRFKLINEAFDYEQANLLIRALLFLVDRALEKEGWNQMQLASNGSDRVLLYLAPAARSRQPGQEAILKFMRSVASGFNEIFNVKIQLQAAVITQRALDFRPEETGVSMDARVNTFFESLEHARLLGRGREVQYYSPELDQKIGRLQIMRQLDASRALSKNRLDRLDVPPTRIKNAHTSIEFQHLRRGQMSDPARTYGLVVVTTKEACAPQVEKMLQEAQRRGLLPPGEDRFLVVPEGDDVKGSLSGLVNALIQTERRLRAMGRGAEAIKNTLVILGSGPSSPAGESNYPINLSSGGDRLLEPAMNGAPYLFQILKQAMQYYREGLKGVVVVTDNSIKAIEKEIELGSNGEVEIIGAKRQATDLALPDFGKVRLRKTPSGRIGVESFHEKDTPGLEFRPDEDVPISWGDLYLSEAAAKRLVETYRSFYRRVPLNIPRDLFEAGTLPEKIYKEEAAKRKRSDALSQQLRQAAKDVLGEKAERLGFADAGPNAIFVETGHSLRSYYEAFRLLLTDPLLREVVSDGRDGQPFEVKPVKGGLVIIGRDVRLGPEVILEPGAIVLGKTQIDKGKISSRSVIVNAQIHRLETEGEALVVNLWEPGQGHGFKPGYAVTSLFKYTDETRAERRGEREIFPLDKEISRDVFDSNRGRIDWSETVKRLFWFAGVARQEPRLHPIEARDPRFRAEVPAFTDDQGQVVEGAEAVQRAVADDPRTYSFTVTVKGRPVTVRVHSKLLAALGFGSGLGVGPGEATELERLVRQTVVHETKKTAGESGGLPRFLTLALVRSPHLGGDHTENGLIFFNKLLADRTALSEGDSRLLFQWILGHELWHEMGGQDEEERLKADAESFLTLGLAPRVLGLLERNLGCRVDPALAERVAGELGETLRALHGSDSDEEKRLEQARDLISAMLDVHRLDYEFSSRSYREAGRTPAIDTDRLLVALLEGYFGDRDAASVVARRKLGEIHEKSAGGYPEKPDAGAVPFSPEFVREVAALLDPAALGRLIALERLWDRAMQEVLGLPLEPQDPMPFADVDLLASWDSSLEEIRGLGVQRGDRWLTIGFGQELAFTVAAARAGARVLAVDLAKTNVEGAQRAAAQPGVERAIAEAEGSIDFLWADATSSEFADSVEPDSYDGVDLPSVVAGLVSARASPIETLAFAVYRAVKDGGRLVLTWYAGDEENMAEFRRLLELQGARLEELPPPAALGHRYATRAAVWRVSKPAPSDPAQLPPPDPRPINAPDSENQA